MTDTAGVQRLRDAHIHDHFGTLFALLLATFVVQGFSEFWWSRLLTSILELCMLGVAFFTTHTKGAKPVVVILGLAGFIGSVAAVLAEHESEAAWGFPNLVVAFIYLAILIGVLRRVLAQRHVTVETILGALCVYFVIGLMFTNLYAAIDAFSVAPLFGEPVPRSDYSYFSFVTLTTVGYGDVVADTDIGRRFAAIEAMTGQIFLATAVARLVSLYGVDLGRLRREPGEHDADEGRDDGTQGGAVQPDS